MDCLSMVVVGVIISDQRYFPSKSFEMTVQYGLNDWVALLMKS